MFTNEQEKSTELTSQRVDRRVQRTRQLLQDAIFLLVIERGYERISIQDITEQANLGRTTFYLHYKDKEELLRASIQALFHQLQREVEPIAEESCLYQTRCIRIFQHITQRQRLYQALLKETGPVNIGNVLQNYFAELFQRYIEEQPGLEALPKMNREIIAAHAAGALLGLIAWWLTQNETPSAEDMGAVYFQLMSKGSGNLTALSDIACKN